MCSRPSRTKARSRQSFPSRWAALVIIPACNRTRRNIHNRSRYLSTLILTTPPRTTIMSPEERTQAINQFRALYNDVLAPVGVLAPMPRADERVGGYRRRAVQTFANALLPQHHGLAKINYSK